MSLRAGSDLGPDPDYLYDSWRQWQDDQQWGFNDEPPWTEADDDLWDLDQRSLTGEYDEQETPCD